jgi:hypothetical protein
MSGVLAKVFGGLLLGMVSVVLLGPLAQIVGLVALMVFTMGLADLVRVARSR